ncbi:chitobiase/beta-hexosaminidase C-terminal domain-containing protein [Pyxidicoccus fallax]|uniref:Lipoprotein n=1 Tax=Pyxidicoccus fallax TaxID=394095 RepID=A0A848L7P4_9BACT|nr:chitobiase/beta-hexosaminidase C-terminal domain-containing protein [Pyxidicoccus fallax]NMO15010.1 hypothetical protein [Pyxidicoccus fallax]NPC83842.1 chitobiase/beta-hexosaminidase C-terminal domain-containing protein [Pyxidicoccus fallax]
MSPRTSWLLRCALALLTAQWVSACGKSDPDPHPNPQPGKDTTAPVTRATPAGGNFTRAVPVALACDDAGGSGCEATYYTLDGSTPTTSSTRYREPFTLTAATTVRFFSVDAAGNSEAAKSEAYAFANATDTQPPTTTASLPGGAYNSPRSVTLTCADGGGSGCAATHYTLDGSVPTQASPRYSAPLTIAATTTLRFFSVDVAGNLEGARQERYVLDTVAPTVSASPAGGNHGRAVEVTLTCDDGNGSGCASIHFTLDGSIPSAASSTYSAPLRLVANTRLRFLAVDRAGNASEEQSQVYTLDRTGPGSTATPKGGLFRMPFTVALACDDSSGCPATYFTLDGAVPTRASERYAGPISIRGNTTLRFFSVDSADNDGPAVTETYVVDMEAPTVSADPRGGAYASPREVRLTCADVGSGCAAIHYTTNGAMPGTGSTRYTGALTVSTNTTLRFISVDVAGNTSVVGEERYTFSSDVTPPVTVASLPSNTPYNVPVEVRLLCADTGGTGCNGTFFTLDGSDPSTSSTRYTGPIPLTASTRLRFRSVDFAGNLEAIKSEDYVIDTAPPVTRAVPQGGIFTEPVTVRLECTDSDSGCMETRFTTDGSTPGMTSPLYEGPFELTRDTTVRFFSVDMAGNAEAEKVERYDLQLYANTASEQIAWVREQPDSQMDMPIDGATVTYAKAFGSNLNDPAGFFIQAERQGPALFVEENPSVLNLRAGDLVNLIVSERRTVNGQVRVRIARTNVTRGAGIPLAELEQNVSAVDVHALVKTYESEYISISGRVGGDFFPAGAGFVQAPLVTAGVPEGSPSANNLRLRVVDMVRDELDLTQGCTVTVFSPLWRFTQSGQNTTQPSVWEENQVSALMCPGPRVASALALERNLVRIRFDRRISPGSVQTNGRQFSIPGLVVTSASVNGNDVLLVTGNQTERQEYTVTVANTVRDTRGSALEPAGASATFKGYVRPARLRLSEIAPAVSSGRDLVELSVVEGGSVLGATLVDGNNPNAPLATLPDVTVQTGDTIVVHLNPDRFSSGVDAPQSETQSRTEYPQAMYSSNYDTAWDFQGEASGISEGNRTLRIRDTFGVTQDAIAAIVIQSGTPFAGYPAQLQALQAEGQWWPPNCGGVPCTYTSFPSALDVSINWTLAFSTPGKTTTLSRVLVDDSDQATDWDVRASTLGWPNP